MDKKDTDDEIEELDEEFYDYLNLRIEFLTKIVKLGTIFEILVLIVTVLPSILLKILY